MFDKEYVFRHGGRPVIYYKRGDISFLDFTNEQWRYVSMDLTNVSNVTDWTHEREWRIRTRFNFDLSEVFVVLPHTSGYREFIHKIDKEVLEQIGGIVVLEQLIS